MFTSGGRSGLSTMGDFLARGAITIGVYADSRSTALMAVTYGLTFLPDLVGGPLLSGLADRFPRRTVMIIIEVGRAALVVTLAAVAMPLPLLWLLFVAARLMDSPSRSAQAATMSVVLTGGKFVVGTAACSMLANLALGIGLANAGGVVELLGARATLYVNAGTYLCSALLITSGVRSRPAARRSDPTGRAGGWFASLTGAARMVRADRRLRILMSFAVIPGICMVSATLAAPYAMEVGAGEAAAGVLMAAGSVGMVVGVWALSRFVRPDRTNALLGILAVVTCLPLVFCYWTPGIAITSLLWFVRGAAMCFWVPVSAHVVSSVRDDARGQMSGLLVALLRLSQGVAVMLYGLLAEVLSASLVITYAGLVGVGVAGAIGLGWRQVGGLVAAGKEPQPSAADLTGK